MCTKGNHIKPGVKTTNTMTDKELFNLLASIIAPEVYKKPAKKLRSKK